MARLQGKNVLITGASSGIGRAIAVRFAQEGANVGINYINRGDAEETEQLVQKAKLSPDQKSILVQADISKEEEVKAMFATIIASFGHLDVLVNNAGIQKPCPSHEVEMKDFDRVVAVNVRGTFMCSREALKHFLTRGSGLILNNSSVHQEIPKPLYASYSVTKGALGNLTRTLALEYADRGIRVNAVGPGAIITPINAAWKDDPVARAGVESHIPMGRAGQPEEIAAVFAFLASDDASYITGQTLYACGGLTLYPEFRTSWSSGG
jgi:glucose 1-dehydrogenase